VNLLLDWLQSWGLPLSITLGLVALTGWAILRLLPNQPATRIYRQLALLVLALLTMVGLTLVLPFDAETRGQLLSLFGLVLTAVIALASTTFVSNAMAGLALRAVGSFHVGDFIHVGESFGRVTERALLHTEIQSEDRDLITLPNLFVMTQPVRVVHASGTLISADVSLGYDVNRHKVRELLKEAAETAGLAEPFVQITSLADHAVCYRVYGFLDDLGKLITKRTELRGKMLDVLHTAGVEIVSPSFMNQRQVAEPVLPDVAPERTEEAEHAESLMFDKAELAARVETLREQHDTLAEELKTLQKEDPDAGHQIAWRERQLKSLEAIMQTLEDAR